MNTAHCSIKFDPYPDPLYLPQEVVKIQLDAFQNNDLMPDDRGIRIAWRFVSPASSRMRRTVDDYIRSVKNPLYAPLIGFERARIGTMSENADGSMAWLHGWVYHGGRISGGFRWVLARRTHGHNAHCWLVDTVVRTL